ncbi:MAG: cell division protein SepF [Armatimonadota bacterium]
MSAANDDNAKPKFFRGLSRRTDEDDSIVQIRVFDNIENYEDHVGIAIALRASESCLLNFENAAPDVKKRMMDYLQGLIYGIDGSMMTVGTDCVVCCPETISVAVGPAE